jgi:hypothetical protein
MPSDYGEFLELLIKQPYVETYAGLDYCVVATGEGERRWVATANPMDMVCGTPGTHPTVVGYGPTATAALADRLRQIAAL